MAFGDPLPPVAKAFAHGVQEASVDQQGDDTAEHQRLHNRCLARRKLIESVMGFELGKQQLGLPAAGIDLGKRLPIHLTQRDIGQIEPMARAPRGAYHEEPQRSPAGTPPPPVAPTLERGFYLDVGRGALEVPLIEPSVVELDSDRVSAGTRRQCADCRS